MRRTALPAGHRRAGFLTPALALAVLTAFLVAAVVLNLGWRRAAEREIVVAADAAALAAAAELACDERLADGPLPQAVLDRVTSRAEDLSSRHAIVGLPALPAPDGVRIGRRVTDEGGRTRLIETDFGPTAAGVIVRRGPDGDLPWLFRAGGHTGGPLAAAAEAVIDGRVACLRPRTGGTVPVWPLAVRAGGELDRLAGGEAAAPTGWSEQIDAELGEDRFGYDADADRVVEGPDGLPELTVTTLVREGDVDDVGLTTVDLGQSFDVDALDRVMRNGLGTDDLTALGGVVPVAPAAFESIDVDALPRLPFEVERYLRPGDRRAIFLFDDLAARGTGFTTRLTGVAAARLMDLQPVDGGWRATFQPAVLATGTAVLADADDGDAPENRYLFKVRLTH